MKQTRNCPLCGSFQNEIIYIQRFSDYFSHAIACCKECGFVFVNNTPTQSFYNKYYRDMSKYENERDHNVHEFVVRLMKKHCSKSSSVLDIGCSTGHLLHLLKQANFKDLSGIDPSPACKILAKQKFGLKIDAANLLAYRPDKKFDCLILASVLEHLPKVRESLIKINRLLNPDGLVIIVVPDADNFYRKFEEPFGEFSIEHINFFSHDSLQWLMKNFRCLQTLSVNGVIYSVWQSGGQLKRSMNKYIKNSTAKLKAIEKKIAAIEGQIVVWGGGSLTQRLFASTKLAAKTVVVVDVNKNLVGKKLSNIPIISPDQLDHYSQPIFISSFRFREEIKNVIKKYRLKNKVITL